MTSNSEKIEIEELLHLGRSIWNRDIYKERSTKSEDRDFREYFGCGILVAINIWNCLVRYKYLPKGGQPHHYLWSLMFMKVYGTEDVMKNLVDTKDPKDYGVSLWNRKSRAFCGECINHDMFFHTP